MVAALVAAFTIGGCGGGDDAKGSDDGDAVVTTAGSGSPTSAPGAPECPPPEATVPGYEGLLECELPDIVFDDDADPQERVVAIAAALREAGLTEQAAVLADGEVTVAEQRQAYQSALDCMTAQGMEVAQFDEYEGLYGTEFFFTVAYGSTTPDEGDRISTECEDRYTSQIKTALPILQGNRFTERAKEVLQECMAEYGVTDDVGDTLDELREVSPSEEATVACQARAENEPAVRPPPGYSPPPGDG